MRNHCFRPIACIALLAAHAGLGAATAPASRWHHPLYAGGGGYWQKRIPIAITDKLGREAAGDPVTLAIGTGPGEADCAGARAAGIESGPAAAALAAAGRLVAIPNAGGRYASQILPDPAALYAAREGVANAIEELRRKLGD